MSSVVDLTIIALLASNGVLMAALPITVIGEIFAMAVILGLVLDGAKFVLFQRLAIA